MAMNTLVTMTMGFAVHDLTPEALAHEHTAEFKHATMALLHARITPEMLESMSHGIMEDIGEGGHADMVRIANRHLIEATPSMAAGRVVRHGCTFFPPNGWHIFGQVSVHAQDHAPFTAKEAAEAYELGLGGPGTIEESVMNELCALPLLLQLEWDREV